ncbi:MAG: response regulator [Lachnospiraceae bacterium]|nr:response regulator [Lachnospiraceae bacterium]MBQ2406096.1 response regulator [Lachnospiraceae bacterium]
MEESQKNEFIIKLARQFYEDCVAVYLLDNEESVYETLKSEKYFEDIVPDKGSLKSLYRMILFNDTEGKENANSKYAVFTDESLFRRNRYQGSLTLNIHNEKKNFEINIIKIDDRLSGMILRSIDEKSNNDVIEKEKMDAIQDSLLFSMIVDLKEDECISANTTEANSDRQDYVNIKYSDWRLQIVNMFLPDDKNMFLHMSSPEYIMDMLDKHKSFKIELEMINMQGEYIWVRLMFSRMKGYSRENPRVVYTVRDIDQEMKRLLNQANIIKAVEEQNEKLKTSDKAKSVFISNMSHEIRTPINAVLGMNEMIIRETTDEKIRSYAYDIKNASKILLSIINDILDFSKIESGKMEIVPVEYDIVSLVNDVKNLISVKLKEKSLELILNISPDIPRKLYGDEIRITQILINLMTNAIKYTEKGTITLVMDSQKLSDDRIGLKVRVQDTGIGIRKEDMEKLFSEFQRLDERRNRNIEGTGLGMSIVLRLLEQMDSKLEVESIYGEGSTFYFTLPQRVVDATPIGRFDDRHDENATRVQNSQNVLKASKAKILVVDDNRVNLKVVKALLKTTGIEIDLADSGKKCLEMLPQKPYHLVLLDHFMPNMDGIETLQKIREMGGFYSTLPVIALTANVVSGAKDNYVSLGFTDFLEKPINVDKMEDALRNYLPKECFD